MKKFLVILMVIAMASFLFVGCLGEGVVTPPVDEDVDEDVDEVVTTTVAPVILTVAGISITSSSTQYINATEAAVVTVTGTAPTYSEVKVYVDAICAGTANVGDTGTFTVVVAEADLGADGDKVIYATAKEAALPVSAHSVEYAFILDQVKPGIDSVAFSASAVDTIDSAIVSGAALIDSAALVGLGTLGAGTWTITCVADSAVANNIVISDGTTSTSYSVESDGATAILFDGVIPGVRFNFGALTVGAVNTITTTIAIDGRATIKFNEDVDYTGMAAGTYAGGLVAVDPTTYKAAVDTGYWTGYTIAAYTVYTITVYGVTDLAGNVGGTSTAPLSASATAGVASATSLKP